MKKLLSLFALATLAITTHATGHKKPGTTSENKIQKEVTGSSKEEWTTDENFNYVSFEKNGQKYSAVYTKEGKLVGTAVLTESAAVPDLVKEVLEKKFEGYQLTGKAIEIEYEEFNSYVVTVENNTQALKVRVDGKAVSVIGKLKKI